MGLQLVQAQPSAVAPPLDVITASELVETPPPRGRPRTGGHTAEFRARKVPDRSVQDRLNRDLGATGELAVVVSEKAWLLANSRADLAELVRHVSAVEGDGAGVDSFELDGSPRFIEVKTTKGAAETDFFISANEVEFSARHAGSYLLYRLHGFDPDTRRGSYYVRHGALQCDASLQLLAVQFRVRLAPVAASPLAELPPPVDVP